MILVGIVFAMTYAHDCEVVHRSPCPGCIALDGSHRPIVCDFAITSLSPQAAVLVRNSISTESDSIGKAIQTVDVFAFVLMLDRSSRMTRMHQHEMYDMPFDRSLVLITVLSHHNVSRAYEH
jgi:hypothetical protein